MSARIVTCPYGAELKGVLLENISCTLWKSLQSHQREVALVQVETGVTVTYGELLTKAELIARRLLGNGCQRNDVIAMFAPNSIDFLIFAAATFRIGAIPALINSQLTVDELRYQLRVCEAAYFYISTDLLSIASQAVNGMHMKKIFADGPNKVGFVNINSCSSFDSTNILLPSFDLLNQQFEDPALIMFSGGTTGLQKAILLSHRNVQSVYASARNPQLAFVGSGSNGSHLIFAPLTHLTGFMLTLAYFFVGDRVFLMSKFHLETFLRVLDENKIDQLFIVPPIATMMVKNAESEKYELSSLRDIITGAAPLSAELEDQLLRRYKSVKTVRQLYGLTASCGAITIVPLYGVAARKNGTAGQPVPGVQMKVIDLTTGEMVGPNIRGEVCIKGPHVMLRYHNNPEATNSTIRDGWLHSGDIGYYDEDGFFFIVDRLKELIKYNAHQVAPAELESVLLSHDEVEDAAVVGLPDAKSGELPLAWVVKKPKATITETQLQQFVDGQVAPFKKLRGGVVFVSSIPKTATGKILRREIKATLLKTKI